MAAAAIKDRRVAQAVALQAEGNPLRRQFGGDRGAFAGSTRHDGGAAVQVYEALDQSQVEASSLDRPSGAALGERPS